MSFQLPQISISPPPPEEPVVEPYSPFSAISSPSSSDEDLFRPTHLTPPPSSTTFNRQTLSPLRPQESTVSSSFGLQRERFEVLLRASRERNSLVGARREIDLRKEITLKAHQTKHDERRARFLSKVLTVSPLKTSLDSPVIFHCTPPSPGLVSPTTHFESFREDVFRPFPDGYERWSNPLDLQSAKEMHPRFPSHHPLPGLGRGVPSLDQISARLGTQVRLRPRTESRPTRLPPFLALNQTARPHTAAVTEVDGPIPWPIKEMPKACTFPPLSSSVTPLPASRECRALNMLSTIKRRTQSTPFKSQVEADTPDLDMRSRRKRHSAPADILPFHPRTGFEHPILALPGAF